MKRRKETTRHRHRRTLHSGVVVPVIQHPMHYWARPHEKYLAIKRRYGLGYANKWCKANFNVTPHVLKQMAVDSDRDNVPDKIDCSPYNPTKQDSNPPLTQRAGSSVPRRVIRGSSGAGESIAMVKVPEREKEKIIKAKEDSFIKAEEEKLDKFDRRAERIKDIESDVKEKEVEVDKIQDYIKTQTDELRKKQQLEDIKLKQKKFSGVQKALGKARELSDIAKGEVSDDLEDVMDEAMDGSYPDDLNLGDVLDNVGLDEDDFDSDDDEEPQVPKSPRKSKITKLQEQLAEKNLKNAIRRLEAEEKGSRKVKTSYRRQTSSEGGSESIDDVYKTLHDLGG